MSLFKAQMETIGTHPGIAVALTKILVHGGDETWLGELEMRTLLDIALVEAVKIQSVIHHLSLAQGYMIQEEVQKI